MNRIIEKFNFPESWFTGGEITLGEHVLLEVDVRHFSPPGWSTYKFMDPDKAAEFASQWAAKGGVVVAGIDSVNNELVGTRDLHYIYAGPLQSFYGTGESEVSSKTAVVEDPKKATKKDAKTTKECSCANLGLTPKPTYKDRMKRGDKKLASQGTFADFYEANKPFKGISKEQWRADVTRIMKEKYGLDPQDFEMQEFDNMTPEDFVQWYAEKYDLDELDTPNEKDLGESSGQNGKEKKGRCWNGYEPVPRKRAYSPGSCKKT